MYFVVLKRMPEGIYFGYHWIISYLCSPFTSISLLKLAIMNHSFHHNVVDLRVTASLVSSLLWPRNDVQKHNDISSRMRCASMYPIRDAFLWIQWRIKQTWLKWKLSGRFSLINKDSHCSVPSLNTEARTDHTWSPGAECQGRKLCNSAAINFKKQLLYINS